MTDASVGLESLAKREWIRHSYDGCVERGRHAKLLEVAEHGMDVLDDRDQFSHSYAADWTNDTDGFEWEASGWVAVSFVSGGYLGVKHYYLGESSFALIHRLVLVAERGFNALAHKHVHHKNGHTADNRSENLEIVDTDQHARHHFSRERGRVL